MTSAPIRVLVLPQDTSPYLRLLYEELERQGVSARYLGHATRSRLLSLVLLPAELLVRRVQGYRLLHVHWVFRFTVRGSERLPVLRLAMQVWFAVFLLTARVSGVHVVWTAHNVLPHSRVFWDERRARRALVRASDLVIAHDAATLDELAALGAPPRASVVIPHGPFTALLPDHTRPPASAGAGSSGTTREFVFFGNVAAYKGVEDLLVAFSQLPPDVPATLLVAGACRDTVLARRLRQLAADEDRVRLRLDRVPDEQVAALLSGAHVLVLPYRAVTTSGAALLGLAAGLPLVAPSMPGLDGLPDAAVHRYDGTVEGLRDAITAMACLPAARLTAMSDAAHAAAGDPSWEPVALATVRAYRSVLDGTSRRGPLLPSA